MELKHPELHDIVARIEESGIHKKPDAQYLWEAIYMFRRFLDSRRILEILDRHPLLLDYAEQEIASYDRALEECPIDIITDPEDLTLLSPPGGYDIGTLNFSGTMFKVKKDELARNAMVLGMIGTGKSTLTLNLMRQMLSSTPEERGFNILCYDQKGDYHHLIKDYPHVWVLDKEDIRYNFFEPFTGEDLNDHITASTKVMAEENYFQATSHPMLENAAYPLFQGGNIPTLPDVHQAVQKYFSTELKGTKGRDLYDVIGKMKLRIERYKRYGEAFICRHGYPLDFWMNNDIIINVTGLDEAVGRHFAIDLIYKIYRYRFVNDKRGQELRTLFICDEASWIFDHRRDENDIQSNDIINKLSKQGREYGIGFLTGFQQSSMASRIIKDNSAYIICHYQNPRAYEGEQEILGLDDEQIKFLSYLQEKGQAVVRCPKHPEPFLLQVPYEDQDKELPFKEARDIMRPRVQPLQASIDSHAKAKEKKSTLENIEQILKEVPGIQEILYELHNNPFTFESQLKEKTGLQASTFSQAIQAMQEHDLLSIPVKCAHGPKANPVFYPLTKTAQEYLGIVPIISPPRFRHTLYEHYIVEYYYRKDIPAKREYIPTTQEMNKSRIDVAAFPNGQLWAHEVTLSTDTLESNLLNCLNTRTDKILVVCESKKLAGAMDTKTDEIMQKHNLMKLRGKITCHSIREFM